MMHMVEFLDVGIDGELVCVLALHIPARCMGRGKRLRPSTQA